MTLLFLLGIIVGVWCVGKLANLVITVVKTKALSLEQVRRELSMAEVELNARSEQLRADELAVRMMDQEKTIGFPWVAQAYADYFHLQDLKKAESLENKDRPAMRGAEQVREIAGQRRAAEKLQRVLQYQLDYYEYLFPWLTDFRSEDIDEIIEHIRRKGESEPVDSEGADPVSCWVTRAEYENLSSIEKNQLALDRYWQRKKTKWEVGRDYERFVGYEYEKAGYSVQYQGIISGFADLGRDLIAKKGTQTNIVQCKYWSQQKTIHEKHIFQLFGTTVEYFLKHGSPAQALEIDLFPESIRRANIRPVFITSTELSDKAREFAAILGVEVTEKYALVPYPSIKCNISRRNGEKIYHLPFDQQYDRTLVEEERNERYVATVREAEALGFRRSFRWRGHQPNAPV